MSMCVRQISFVRNKSEVWVQLSGSGNEHTHTFEHPRGKTLEKVRVSRGFTGIFVPALRTDVVPVALG